jgi:hypothetical protein
MQYWGLRLIELTASYLQFSAALMEGNLGNSAAAYVSNSFYQLSLVFSL